MYVFDALRVVDVVYGIACTTISWTGACIAFDIFHEGQPKEYEGQPTPFPSALSVHIEKGTHVVHLLQPDGMEAHEKTGVDEH